MKHVIFSKVGMKIYFHPKNWNYAGGAFDYLNTCLAIVHHNPENQYYFCQSSDVGDLTSDEFKKMFPNNNVHFPYEDFVGPLKDNDNKWVESNWQPFLAKWFDKRGIKPDMGILDFGMYFNTNLMNTVKSDKSSHGEYAMPSIMAKRYCMPIVYLVNHFKFPYITLHHDPRSDLKQRDIFNKPFFMASQCNHEYEYNTWSPEKDDFIVSKYKQEYFGIQESALIGHTKNTDSINKSKLFGIVCNQSKAERNVIDRTQILKDFILEFGDEVEIFGKWDPEISDNDSRFKGVVPKKELDSKIRDWKYSLCIPIGKDWTTSKYLEMISNRIVPFLHPYYDSQKNTNLPHDFLHVKNSKDLKKKIDYLETGNNYKKFIDKLYNHYMKDEFLSGSALNNRIMKKFDADYVDRQPAKTMINFWSEFLELKKNKEISFL